MSLFVMIFILDHPSFWIEGEYVRRKHDGEGAGFDPSHHPDVRAVLHRTDTNPRATGARTSRTGKVDGRTPTGCETGKATVPRVDWNVWSVTRRLIT
jgi:hypothetical protein